VIALVLYLQSALRPSAHPPLEWVQIVLAEATCRGVDVQDHYKTLRCCKRDIEDGIEGAEHAAIEAASTVAVKALRAIASVGYIVTTAKEEGDEWVLIYGPAQKAQQS